jgi:Ca2+-transporting ATPase
VLTRRHWLAIGVWGLLITAAVLGALALALVVLGMDERRAITVSFLTLAFAQLWHVFNMRGAGSGWLRNDVVRNPWVWGALALCTGLLLAALRLPLLAGVLQLSDPGIDGWLVIAAMSFVPLLAGSAGRAFAK